jgi:1-phosphofructokinase
MIYTVTFNPSLDYIVTVPAFEIGKTNRTGSEQLLPGGKGINVSAVLKNLGMESIALGFVAGFSGTEIVRRLEEMQLKSDFIHLPEGFSRINMKLKNYDGTEINGRGPEISGQEAEELLRKLDRLKEGDTLVMAGSIPESMPSSIYRDIMERLQGRGIRFVIDATRELLLNVLEFHPFLIKPNNHELGEIFGVELMTRESVVPYARKLQERGAMNVLVSMAGKGAVLLDAEGGVHMLPAPEGKLVNAVGAGDSMVAGFIAGWEEQQDYEHAFRMGISAGSASAFSELLATREEVEAVFRALQHL